MGLLRCRRGHHDRRCLVGEYSGHILDEDDGDLIGVELQISDWPIAGSRCFVWSPHGQLHADDYEYGLRHLTGPWWGCRGWDGW
jgi:hypothetical protein